MVSYEYIDSEGAWCVVFRAYPRAPDDFAMILSKHKEEQWAKRYAENFNVVLNTCIAHEIIAANAA